jgi:hypothetical protein
LCDKEIYDSNYYLVTTKKYVPGTSTSSTSNNDEKTMENNDVCSNNLNPFDDNETEKLSCRNKKKNRYKTKKDIDHKKTLKNGEIVAPTYKATSASTSSSSINDIILHRSHNAPHSSRKDAREANFWNVTWPMLAKSGWKKVRQSSLVNT